MFYVWVCDRCNTVDRPAMNVYSININIAVSPGCSSSR